MKKQTLKNLALHKKTISTLDKGACLKGGLTGTASILGCNSKNCPQDPTPETVFPRCESRFGACPM